MHAMKMYRWSGGVAPLILYLGSRWHWVIGFCPAILLPLPAGPHSHLDILEKREIYCPCWDSNPGSPTSILVTVLTAQWIVTLVSCSGSTRYSVPMSQLAMAWSWLLASIWCMHGGMCGNGLPLLLYGMHPYSFWLCCEFHHKNLDLWISKCNRV